MSIHKLLTYTVSNKDFQETKLYHIDRDDSKGSGPLDGILPPDDTEYPLYTAPTTPISQDAVVHSYMGEDDELRFLVGKINTDPVGEPSQTCVYTELDADYAAVSEPDITLVEEKDGPPVATDPHGITQVGATLYISDYDSIKIPFFGNEALQYDAVDGFLELPNSPLDLTSILPSPPTGYLRHGNGIISLKNGSDTYLFTVFIVHNGDAVPTHLESQLVRIKLNSSGTAATDLAVIQVGRNIVDMDVTFDKDGNPVLTLTGIGGGQRGGSTNEEDSMISKVVDLFSANFTKGNNLVDLIKGNSWDPNNPVGDLRGMNFGGAGNVDILAGFFNDQNYTGFNWDVYRADKSTLLSLQKPPISISQAIEQEIFTQIGHDTCSPGYYWGLMSGGGRLIFLKGTSIMIMDEAKPDFRLVGGNNIIFGPGSGSGETGNVNANSIDFTESTMAMIAKLLNREGYHHHHHRRHHYLHHLAQQARQASQAASEAREA
jgi:hypothetical protein